MLGRTLRLEDLLLQLLVALYRPRTTQELLLRSLLYHVDVGLGAISPHPYLVVRFLGDVHAKVEEELRDGVEIRVHVSHVAQSQQPDLLALVDLLAFLPVVDGEAVPSGHLHGFGGIERVAHIGGGSGGGGGDGLALHGSC